MKPLHLFKPSGIEFFPVDPVIYMFIAKVDVIIFSFGCISRNFTGI